MPDKKSSAATEKAELSKFWKSFIIAGLAFLITYYSIQILEYYTAKADLVIGSEIIDK